MGDIISLNNNDNNGKTKHVNYSITEKDKEELDEAYERAFPVDNLSIVDDLFDTIYKFGGKIAYALKKIKNDSYIDIWPTSFSEKFSDVLHNLSINGKMFYHKDYDRSNKILSFKYDLESIANSIVDNAELDKELYELDGNSALIIYMAAAIENITDNSKKLGEVCNYNFDNAIIDEGLTTDFGSVYLNARYRDKIYTNNYNWLEDLYSNVRTRALKNNNILPNNFTAFAESCFNGLVPEGSKLYYSSIDEDLKIIPRRDLDKEDKETYVGSVATIKNFIELGKLFSKERENAKKSSEYSYI